MGTVYFVLIALFVIASPVVGINLSLRSGTSVDSTYLRHFVDVYFDPETQAVLKVRDSSGTTLLDLSAVGEQSTPPLGDVGPRAALSWKNILDRIVVPPDTSSYSLDSLFRGRKGLHAYISSTDNGIGYERSRRLEKQCLELGIKCTRLIPVMRGGKLVSLAKTMMQALKQFRQSDKSEIALYIEDDTEFIVPFYPNLRRAVMELPKRWEVFHLCPGYLHNRGLFSTSFNLSLQGKLLNNPKASPDGRVFLEWPHGSVAGQIGPNGDLELGIIPGGPVSMLMTKYGAHQIEERLKQELQQEVQQEMKPTDVILMEVGIRSMHFIARQPQLCREFQDGHTTMTTTTPKTIARLRAEGP